MELYIYQFINEKLDVNNPKLLATIHGGYKSYVNEKDEICVINSDGIITIYSYDGESNEIKKDIEE